MPYVAKVMNCASGKTVTFDSGEVSLASSGFTLNANYVQKENIVPGIIDDAYNYKEVSNITLNIGITCTTPEQARNKAEEILAVFSGKARVYLFDDRYIYVYPKGNSGKYSDGDTRYVDLSINLVAEPFFLREVEKELIVTPTDYPTRVEMENPDPRINLTFAKYNITTGAKTSDTVNTDLKIDHFTDVTYSGGKCLTLPRVGESATERSGFNFVCYGDFVLSMYASSFTRTIRVFVDGIPRDISWSITSLNKATNGVYSLPTISATNGVAHTITVINVSARTDLYIHIDSIDLSPSSIQTLINNGTTDSYPVIEIAPTDTTIRYSPLGKITRDETHPVTIRTNTANTLPTNLSSGSELTGTGWSNYANVYFLDGLSVSPTRFGVPGSEGYYSYCIITYDLKATKSGIKTSWTPDEIKTAIKSLTSRVWAYGEGVDTSVTHWKNACENINDFSTSSGYYSPKLSSIETTNQKQGVGYFKMVIAEKDTVAADTRRGVTFPNIPVGKYLVSAFVRGNKKSTLFVRNPALNVVVKATNDTTDWVRVGVKLGLSSISNIDVGLEINLLTDNYVLGDYSCIDAISIMPITDEEYNNASVASLLSKYSYDGEVKNGVEVKWWVPSASAWSATTRTTTANTPILLQFDWTDTADIMTTDSKIYLLVKSLYPSDGIAASTVCLDHCNLDLVYSRAIVGTDMIINRIKNLLPPFKSSEWTKHTNAFIVDDYELSLDATTSNQHTEITLPVIGGAKYLCTVNTNASVHYKWYNDLAQLTSDYGKENNVVTAPINANKVILQCTNGSRTDVKTYYWRNPILTQTDSIQPFAPQEKHTISLSQPQSIPYGKKLLIKSDNDSISLDGINLIQYAGSSYLSNGFLIRTGLNHLQCNNTGSLMKVKVKYKEKFNTP